MNCPFCNSEMTNGIVKVSGSIPLSYNVSWFSDEEKNNIFKENLIELSNSTKGYYCENCNKIIAIYDKK